MATDFVQTSLDALNDIPASTKTNFSNNDKSNATQAIQKAKDNDKMTYVNLINYDSEDVSAYVYFNMYTYKRGRQESRVEGTSDNANTIDAVKGAVGGGITGALAGAFVAGVPGAIIGGVGGAGAGGTQYRRTRDTTDFQGAIILPLTTPVTMGYAVNWGTFDSLLNAENAIAGAGAAAKAFVGSSAVLSRGQKGVELANLALQKGGQYAANVLANETGMVFNPDTELVLQGIGLRHHSFEFTLTPRNQREKVLIQKAIRTFKSAMHPSKSGIKTANSSSNISYPYEFSIYFMDGRKGFEGERLDIPIIPDCACIACDVAYNPQGPRFHTDRSVGQYRITLQFMEHNTLTKDDIEEGDF